METMQPLSMLHVKMEVGAESWAHQVPWGHNCLIYVRRGELTVVPTEEGYYEGDEDREPQVRYAARALVCYMCCFEPFFFRFRVRPSWFLVCFYPTPNGQDD